MDLRDPATPERPWPHLVEQALVGGVVVVPLRRHGLVVLGDLLEHGLQQPRRHPLRRGGGGSRGMNTPVMATGLNSNSSSLIENSPHESRVFMLQVTWGLGGGR